MRHALGDAQRHPAPAVLYLSPTLLAVDKPSGIIVHGDGTGTPTLTDLVRAHIEQAAPETYPAHAADELQALQRLDRETSGIVLFSLAKGTQPAYDRMIAEHALEKRYLAVACGRIPWRERTLTWPIGRDRHDARRMRASRTGKPALTRAHVVAVGSCQGAPVTLVDVAIETGRKHQIRVHLARAGHPLVGDDLYGAPRISGAPAGLMLHAHRIAFTDPVSGEPVRIESPAPARIRALFPRAR